MILVSRADFFFFFYKKPQRKTLSFQQEENGAVLHKRSRCQVNKVKTRDNKGLSFSLEDLRTFAVYVDVVRVIRVRTAYFSVFIASV